jgi:HSP20 family protein
VAEACTLIDRIERPQRPFFQLGRFAAPAVSWEPPIDILEIERELSIIAALPPVEPSDLEITIDQGVPSIAGLRRLPATARVAAIHRLEIPYPRFQRRTEFPETGLKLGRPKLANGCLYLTLTKRVWDRVRIQVPQLSRHYAVPRSLSNIAENITKTLTGVRVRTVVLGYSINYARRQVGDGF